jgi:DNA polymerase-4
MWHLIRGDEIKRAEYERASISHSKVLAPKERTADDAWRYLVALLVKGCMRLREEGFYATTLSLYLKFQYSYSFERGSFERGSFEERGESSNQVRNSRYWEGKVSFFESNDTEIFLMGLEKLWLKARKESLQKHHVLRVGVVLSGLVPTSKHQLSIFEDIKREKLMSAIDALNMKYIKQGRRKRSTITIASSADLKAAPIAFRHIPKEYE